MSRMAGADNLVTPHGRSAERRGTVTVELAFILPVILFLLFSILEMGFMIKNRAELGQAAREAARVGAVGSTPARMDEGVNSSLAGIPADDVVRSYEHRHWDDEAGAWGDWTQLGVKGTENDANESDQIRVKLEYDHGLLVPGIMAPVLNADDDGNVHLSAASVMMRE